MNFELKHVEAELVVVGAGAAGICCALQAARMGVDTVLINDRGCVGGNNSTEIFVSLNGANDGNALNINLREGGIVDELRQEYNYRAPQKNRYALDGVFMDSILKEKHLRLFLNTCIDEIEADDQGRIMCVRGTQNSTETRWSFAGRWFVDDTGDGALGALAGAEFMLGREAAATFGERIAPEKADSFVLPSTLSFTSRDTGAPVRYVAPDFADDIPASGALSHRIIPHRTFDRVQWYYEVSGEMDQVKDRETIMQKHRGLITGIWDYIKNSGEYPEAENYDLEYIACVPGMREYRRLTGDYILTERELVEQWEYDDAVGHGGWNIDLHAIRGFYDSEIINRHIHFRGPYQIPYRCGYSVNVENLFMCGRCMSTSHVAFGSTRVAATLSTLGQAVGMAAFLCKKHGATPRGVYESHRAELQQRLLREDQLILGARNEDSADHALTATISASSELLLEAKTGRDYRYDALGEGLGLVIPIKERLDSLTLQADAARDTTLTYRVYLPAKLYNYGPDTLLSEHSVPVTKGKALLSLPFAIREGGRYYFIELCKNDDLRIMTVENELPTTMLFSKYINTAATNWDYSTMKAAEAAWSRTDRLPCFTPAPAQRVFAAASVGNGYNRAYGLPNLWHAAFEDAQPSLCLAWDAPVTLSQVRLTFAIDTTSILVHYHKPFFAGVAADYRIFAVHEGRETLLCEVRDNHMKCRSHQFAPTRCTALRIVFDRGAYERRIGVQEIRAE